MRQDDVELAEFVTPIFLDAGSPPTYVGIMAPHRFAAPRLDGPGAMRRVILHPPVILSEVVAWA
jgi:hypothetical protein